MKSAEVEKFAGYREHRVNETTGGYNVLLNADEADLDTTGGNWAVICDEHSTICNFSTRRNARSVLKSAPEWCHECR